MSLNKKKVSENFGKLMFSSNVRDSSTLDRKPSLSNKKENKEKESEPQVEDKPVLNNIDASKQPTLLIEEVKDDADPNAPKFKSNPLKPKPINRHARVSISSEDEVNDNAFSFFDDEEVQNNVIEPKLVNPPKKQEVEIKNEKESAKNKEEPVNKPIVMVEEEELNVVKNMSLKSINLAKLFLTGTLYNEKYSQEEFLNAISESKNTLIMTLEVSVLVYEDEEESFLSRLVSLSIKNELFIVVGYKYLNYSKGAVVYHGNVLTAMKFNIPYEESYSPGPVIVRTEFILNTNVSLLVCNDINYPGLSDLLNPDSGFIILITDTVKDFSLHQTQRLAYLRGKNVTLIIVSSFVTAHNYLLDNRSLDLKLKKDMRLLKSSKLLFKLKGLTIDGIELNSEFDSYLEMESYLSKFRLSLSTISSNNSLIHGYCVIAGSTLPIYSINNDLVANKLVINFVTQGEKTHTIFDDSYSVGGSKSRGLCDYLKHLNCLRYVKSSERYSFAGFGHIAWAAAVRSNGGIYVIELTVSESEKLSSTDPVIQILLSLGALIFVGDSELKCTKVSFVNAKPFMIIAWSRVIPSVICGSTLNIVSSTGTLNDILINFFSVIPYSINELSMYSFNSLKGEEWSSSIEEYKPLTSINSNKIDYLLIKEIYDNSIYYSNILNVGGYYRTSFGNNYFLSKLENKIRSSVRGLSLDNPIMAVLISAEGEILSNLSVIEALRTLREKCTIALKSENK